MNKSNKIRFRDLTRQTAEALKLPQELVNQVVRQYLQQVHESVLNLQDVTMHGVGTIHVVAQKARLVRMVKYGKLEQIPARYQVKFTPSVPLKKQVQAIKIREDQS